MSVTWFVGLGNPGPDYADTRHNTGAWFLERLVHSYQGQWKTESKFKGQVARINIAGQDCRCLVPHTFMNHSGQAVQAIASFFQYSAETLLVAHDELDLPAGVVRLKQGGGHGGHNGLRDIIALLGTDQFTRLRIGIGHPGHKDRVTPFVLSPPTQAEQVLIEESLVRALAVVPDLVTDQQQRAMQTLHTD